MVIWMGFHWQFMAHFLEKAVLFKDAFKEHSDVNYSKLNYHKRLVFIFEILGYVVLAAMLIFEGLAGSLVDVDFKAKFFTWQCVYNSIVITSSLTTLFAMRYIHEHSKHLEELGLSANSLLMCLYAVLWGIAGIIALAFTILDMCEFYCNFGLITNLRILIGIQSLLFPMLFVSTGLDMLMLYTYLRFSDKISD